MKPLMTLVVTSILTSIVATHSPLADESPNNSSNTKNKGTKPAKMSCEEFIALDDTVKPKVVYWAEGFNRKGNPEDAVVDIEETDRLVPVLVEECSKAPKKSFWSRVKTKLKK